MGFHLTQGIGGIKVGRSKTQTHSAQPVLKKAKSFEEAVQLAKEQLSKGGNQ